jgi:hypothetical protein
MPNLGAALRAVGADRLGFRAVADAIAGFETGQDLKAIAGAVPCFRVLRVRARRR